MYNVLQKLAYLSVVIAFPILILARLAMSPAINSAFPWLLTLFGGRQAARAIHFLLATYLVLFVIVHLVMVVLFRPHQQHALDNHPGRYRIKEQQSISKRSASSSRRARASPAAGSSLASASAPQLRRSPPAAWKFSIAGVMSILDKAKSLTEAVQHTLLAPRTALAPEYPPGAISSYFKFGSVDPDDPAYVAQRQGDFKSWKLEVAGLVDRPMKLTLADLRAMPSRSQMTSHDCVEELELHRAMEGRAIVGAP